MCRASKSPPVLQVSPDACLFLGYLSIVILIEYNTSLNTSRLEPQIHRAPANYSPFVFIENQLHLKAVEIAMVEILEREKIN